MNKITHAKSLDNTTKTNYIIITKHEAAQDQIDGTYLERVNKLTYLRTVIKDQWDTSYEVKIRIVKTPATFV